MSKSRNNKYPKPGIDERVEKRSKKDHKKKKRELEERDHELRRTKNEKY